MSDLEDLVADKEPPAEERPVPAALPAPTAPAPEKKSALDRMVSGVETEPPKDLVQQLGGIKRQEMAETEQASGLVRSRMHKDQQQMERAYNAAGVGPDTLPPPWDADGMMAKYSTDPIAAFGSIASVFGIAAAAFTKAPMENALNASASAMNAIQAKDEKAYEKAHQAWKENTDLAVKRHTMLQQDYDNAIRKFGVNAQAGKIEMQLVAQKYGDQAALTLLEGGYDERLQNLLDSRNKAKLQLINTAVHIEQQHDQMQQRKLEASQRHEDRVAETKRREAADLDRAEDRAGRREDRDYVRAERERSNKEKEDIARKRAEETERAHKAREAIKSGDPKAVRAGIIEDLASDDPQKVALGEKKYEALKRVEALTNAKGGVQTMSRIEAAEVIRRQNEKIDAGMDPTKAFDEARKEVATAGKAPSAVDARRDETVRKVDATLDEAIAVVEKQLSRTGKSVTGAKGEANRWIEWGGNLMGAKPGTEAHDFAQKVRIIEALLPQALGSRANIAKDERDKAQQIVGGLSRFTPEGAALNDLKFLKKLISKSGGPEGGKSEPAKAGAKSDVSPHTVPIKSDREDGKTYPTPSGDMVWSASDGLWYTPDEWKARK